MRSLSLYAKNHQWFTRLVIILILYPLLNISGWILGILLWEEGVLISSSVIYITALISLILASTYPGKRRAKQHYYLIRKTYHGLLALATFCFIVFTGNHFCSSQQYYKDISPVHASVNNSSMAFEKPSKQGKNSIKKFFKSLIKKYNQASDGEKVLLIILTILVAAGVIYLLAVLSCSIACAGSEALAYVVFLLGLGGIIFSVVKIIQSISRKSRKKEAGMQSS